MLAKNYRHIAWNKLKDKWGTMALIALISFAITGACSALSRYVVGVIATLLLGGPITFGWAVLSLKIADYKDVSVEEFFCGFKDYTRCLVLYLLQTVFVFLWMLLLIVPGIIKSYAYSLSFYLLAENPELTAQEALKRSEELMTGNKWRLFCLQFSFIGWFLLCILTLGILTFWIEPYYQATMAEFYLSVLPESRADSAREDTSEETEKVEE